MTRTSQPDLRTSVFCETLSHHILHCTGPSKRFFFFSKRTFFGSPSYRTQLTRSYPYVHTASKHGLPRRLHAYSLSMHRAHFSMSKNDHLRKVDLSPLATRTKKKATCVAKATTPLPRHERERTPEYPPPSPPPPPWRVKWFTIRIPVAGRLSPTPDPGHCARQWSLLQVWSLFRDALWEVFFSVSLGHWFCPCRFPFSQGWLHLGFDRQLSHRQPMHEGGTCLLGYRR